MHNPALIPSHHISGNRSVMFLGHTSKAEVAKLKDDIVHKLTAVAEKRYKHFDNSPPLYLFRFGVWDC